MVPYILLVIFCIMYMGQHYLIDAIVGIAYAGIVYAGVMYGLPWVMHRLRPAPVTRHLAASPAGGVFVPQPVGDRETAEKVG
jgi:hypothetical protein